MPKHIHADLMLQYAQDAMETDKPWERWELRYCEEESWAPCGGNFVFDPSLEYRRKPRTININGFEVPEPVLETLKVGQQYYTAEPDASSFFCVHTWNNHTLDIRRLQRGLIHLTREAAELHAKALLSFTEKKA